MLMQEQKLISVETYRWPWLISRLSKLCHLMRQECTSWNLNERFKKKAMEKIVSCFPKEMKVACVRKLISSVFWCYECVCLIDYIRKNQSISEKYHIKTEKVDKSNWNEMHRISVIGLAVLVKCSYPHSAGGNDWWSKLQLWIIASSPLLPWLGTVWLYAFPRLGPHLYFHHFRVIISHPCYPVFGGLGCSLLSYGISVPKHQS